MDARYIIAMLLPWLSFFTMGMPLCGIACLVLQVSLIGWLPAVIWAFFTIYNYDAASASNRSPS